MLIDNLRTTDADGKVTETPLPPEQLDRLTALVRDAVGFDATRGDTVNVVNSSFLGTPAIEEGELESIPFWERAWAQTLAKVLAGLVDAADHRVQRAEAADQGTADRRASVGVAPGGARGRAAVAAQRRRKRRRSPTNNRWPRRAAWSRRIRSAARRS